MSSQRRPFKEKFKDLLALNRGERNGATILLGLCLAASAWVTYEQFIHPDPVEDMAELQANWRPMAAAIQADSSRWQGSGRQPVEREVVLFPFDPNGLPVEQWVALGLSERQADVIHRFEAKGGRFRSKKDVARMRVVAPELFAQWEPFIQLPDSMVRADRSIGKEPYQEGARSEPFERRSSVPQERIELNTTDSSGLVELPGIGPSFAKGMLRYRDKLGGYHSLDQLAEVHVLKDKPDALVRLKELLVVDPQLVRRFNVNLVTADELGPHPYAGWKVAKALVAYRKQHGNFKDVAAIRGCALVTDTIYLRLAPYLMVE